LVAGPASHRALLRLKNPPSDTQPSFTFARAHFHSTTGPVGLWTGELLTCWRRRFWSTAHHAPRPFLIEFSAGTRVLAKRRYQHPSPRSRFAMPASRDGLSESYMIGDEAMMHHQQQMQQRSFPGANYAHEPPPQQQVSVSHPRGRAPPRTLNPTRTRLSSAVSRTRSLCARDVRLCRILLVGWPCGVTFHMCARRGVHALAHFFKKVHATTDEMWRCPPTSSFRHSHHPHHRSPGAFPSFICTPR
jgi:hypothetical protein